MQVLQGMGAWSKGHRNWSCGYNCVESGCRDTKKRGELFGCIFADSSVVTSGLYVMLVAASMPTVCQLNSQTKKVPTPFNPSTELSGAPSGQKTSLSLLREAGTEFLHGWGLREPIRISTYEGSRSAAICIKFGTGDARI